MRNIFKKCKWQIKDVNNSSRNTSKTSNPSRIKKYLKLGCSNNNNNSKKKTNNSNDAIDKEISLRICRIARKLRDSNNSQSYLSDELINLLNDMGLEPPTRDEVSSSLQCTIPREQINSEPKKASNDSQKKQEVLTKEKSYESRKSTKSILKDGEVMFRNEDQVSPKKSSVSFADTVQDNMQEFENKKDSISSSKNRKSSSRINETKQPPVDPEVATSRKISDYCAETTQPEEILSSHDSKRTRKSSSKSKLGEENQDLLTDRKSKGEVPKVKRLSKSSSQHYESENISEEYKLEDKRLSKKSRKSSRSSSKKFKAEKSSSRKDSFKSHKSDKKSYHSADYDQEYSSDLHTKNSRKDSKHSLNTKSDLHIDLESDKGKPESFGTNEPVPQITTSRSHQEQYSGLIQGGGGSNEPVPQITTSRSHQEQYSGLIQGGGGSNEPESICKEQVQLDKVKDLEKENNLSRVKSLKFLFDQTRQRRKKFRESINAQGPKFQRLLPTHVYNMALRVTKPETFTPLMKSMQCNKIVDDITRMKILYT